MSSVAQDTLSSIYGTTAQLEITECLAPIKGSEVRVLSFATIVTPLRTECVHKRVVSLALSDKNQIFDNWIQISSCSFKVLP